MSETWRDRARRAWLARNHNALRGAPMAFGAGVYPNERRFYGLNAERKAARDRALADQHGRVQP